MAGTFLLIFTLVWSGIVLTFDGLILRSVYRQYAASHYPAAPGTITRSEVTHHRTSKGGTSYNALIEYRFTVDGREYTGDRLRFGMASSSLAIATAAVEAHPAGSAATVYYNPADPQQAILDPGLAGSDFIGVLFLTPFNMVLLGLWTVNGGWLRERLAKPVAGGVKIITDGPTTRIRLPQTPAFVAGLATAGGLGFASIFVLGFSTNMAPSLPLALLTIAVVYLAGLLVYCWQRWKIDSGLDDLILHVPARTLELPLTFGRKERVTVNAAAIECLAVKTIVHRNSKGGTSYTYAPTLYARGAGPEGEKLADWSDRRRANDFTEWLRQQLGAHIPAEISAPPAEDSPAVADDDATAPLRPPAGDMRHDERSPIKVSNGPDGREFYFPAARNPGAAVFTLIIFVIFAGLVFLLATHHAPIPFTAAFGFFSSIIGCATFGLWFKSTRVTVNPSGVTRTHRWLLYARTRRFEAGEIIRINPAAGMTSGSKKYYDLRLVTRSARAPMAAPPGGNPQNLQLSAVMAQVRRQIGATLASGINTQAEANWLAWEMTKALGRANKDSL
jgi:Protein of unknown function (DUF3592)